MLTPLMIVMLLLYIVMLVLGIVKQEYRGSNFWFQALVGLAVLVISGVSL